MEHKKIARLAVGLLAGVMLAQGAAMPVMAAPGQPWVAAAAVPSDIVPDVNPGEGKWVERNGNRYRYDGEGHLVTGYFDVEGKRYYAQKSGNVISKAGWFQRDDKKTAYARQGGGLSAKA